MQLFDIHTHTSKPLVGEDTEDTLVEILDVSPQQYPNLKQAWVSCGIHPWYVQEQASDLLLLEQYAQQERVVAIGEIGLDKLSDTPFDLQTKLFLSQIAIAEQVKKPIIIHCVKAWDELIAIYKSQKRNEAWIIHGFRGKSEQAKQLLDLGFYISFGLHYNKETLKITPLDRLFLETDMADVEVKTVYANVASDLGLETIKLSNIVTCNVNKVFK